MSLAERLVLCIVTMLLFESNCFANPYMLISGGAGGAAKAGSIGVEVGGTRAINDTAPLSIEFTVAFTGSVPSNLLDNPAPQQGYQQEEYRDGEYGLLFKSGYTINNLTILGGVGASIQETVRAAHDPVSGFNYEQSSYSDLKAQVYAGVLYKFDNIAVSAGYDNRRGAVVGLGYIW